MGHHHHHGHSHGHSHQFHGKKLFWAILFNIILTVVQIVAGFLSGSLSLIADALHNLSDAGALVIAYIANRISGLPANSEMTFGYGRAQILGALINSVALVVVGIYLMYEASVRFLNPQEVDGWILIYVAGAALVVDLITAWLTYAGSKDNLNMRAAFIHNISDAMASVVVMLSGVMIILYQTYWIDLVATVIISIYVLYHSFDLIKETVKILMQAVPADVNKEEVVKKIEDVVGVKEAHHIHIWSLHDKFRSLEGHIVVSKGLSVTDLEEVKQKIKLVLKNFFRIEHSTIEFECETNKNCKGKNKKGEGC